MAKKKQTEDSGNDEPKLDSVLAKLEKEFGLGIIVGGNSVIDKKSVIVPFSPALDGPLGGGIPEGSFVIETGPPKAGKSVSALDFAATALTYSCDLIPNGQREAYYLNIEGRLKPRDLEGIHHLRKNIDRFHIITSQPGHILTGEHFIGIGERLVNEKPGCILIIDSFSQLCTAGEMQSELSDRYRADAPVLLAKFCRRISNVVPINKSIVFGITHQIANQGGMGHSPWTEASGRKVQYQSDIKLSITHAVPWKSGETQVGQDVNWVCNWSAIGAPGRKCISKLRYGYGIDKPAELVELASQFGLIVCKGCWYEFPNGQKAQGLENAREILVDEKGEPNELYRELNKEVRSMLGLAI